MELTNPIVLIIHGTSDGLIHDLKMNMKIMLLMIIMMIMMMTMRLMLTITSAVLYRLQHFGCVSLRALAVKSGQAVDRKANPMQSKTFSTATLLDGINEMDQQQVKVEPDQDKAEMERELKDLVWAVGKSRNNTQESGLMLDLFSHLPGEGC